uniref:peptidylprolyl isomerase n=1 Tax=Cyprinus carpio TaxID=7962 RepID=A0A8C1MS52_CYPCA
MAGQQDNDYSWRQIHGAKLASLFGLDQAASQGNESFQYTAPKQPRKSSANSGPPTQKGAPPPNSPAVLFATAVHAYRYVNGQYVKQGKLGAAVLGTHSTKEVRMITNYCTFYDDQRQNWSLMFESEKAATDFCKEVCLAKVNCSSALDSVLIQDLVLGEGQSVENGDSLEVAYSGWLLQNHTIGQMFDSNLNKDKLLRLKLGAGKVIKGWEEGMLNMRKGGKRLMVIPPSLAYGSQGVANRVPPDSTLVFEAEIRRVKFAKDGNSRDSAAPSPAPSVESLTPSELNQPLSTVPQTSKPSEPPLRAKSDSLSEQLGNPDATKAKLISRMAKMGQPMLPFMAGPASSPSQPDSSDSELEARFIFVRHSLRTVSPNQTQHKDLPLIPLTSCIKRQLTVISSLQPVSQMYPTQTVPYQGTTDVTSFLMTEARQHNTEIRLAVGKVADKLDHLSSKVGSVSLGLSNVSMETAMIMHNIQRIIQENECLKKEVFEKSSRIEGQNRKIGELINQNQRYVEQNNLRMEQRNDSLKNSSEQNQARILQAEQDKVTLFNSPIHHTHNNTRAALQTLYLYLCVSELKETADRVQSQYKMEKQKRKELEHKLNNMEEELQDLKTEKDSLERTLSERKRKMQLERQRCDEELEEVRRAGQQELDNLRSQLRKARTSTDQATAEQLSQLQADLEQEWQVKCDQALAAAREQQRREMTELSEHRDALQLKLTQLQDKCSALEQRAALLKQQGETRVSELERKLMEEQQTDTVKRVMNGVFQSLRGEFDLSETYTGSAVLRVLVSTIKNVTLQLLTKKERSSSEHSEKEEEEEEEENEEEREADAQPRRELHINGQREEEEQRERDPAGQDEDGPQQVEKKDVSPAKEKKEETEELERQDKSEQEVVEEKSEEKVVEEKEVEVTERNVQDQEISESGAENKQEEETERDVTSKQEVTTELPEDISPTQEVKVIDESVSGPLDEPESTHMTLGGPPKNPPPPPPALQDESSDTSALLSKYVLNC